MALLQIGHFLRRAHGQTSPQQEGGAVWCWKRERGLAGPRRGCSQIGLSCCEDSGQNDWILRRDGKRLCVSEYKRQRERMQKLFQAKMFLYTINVHNIFAKVNIYIDDITMSWKHWMTVSNKTGCFECYSAIFLSSGWRHAWPELIYWEGVYNHGLLASPGL